MSPGRNFGTKEYRCPHLVQKPSVRPGCPVRPRPTGAPQLHRLQNRFRSGTAGFSRTAVRGSVRGTSGTDTSPAPSLLRREEPDEERELRTETDRETGPPGWDRDSRPDTDRLDDGRADRREPLCPEAAEPELPPPVTPVGGDPTSPPEDTAGAIPQVPQYRSPPPTSS